MDEKNVRDLNTDLLPKTNQEWLDRIQKAINEMRRPDLLPCSMESYRKHPDGAWMAGIDGVLNDMAIKSGINAEWVEQPHWAPDEDDPDGWEEGVHYRAKVNDPKRPNKEHHNDSPTNAILTEALLWHGIRVDENGHHEISIDLIDPRILVPMRAHQCESMTELPLGLLNDMLHETEMHTFEIDPVNPLLFYADLLEEMMKQPDHIFWDPAIAEMQK